MSVCVKMRKGVCGEQNEEWLYSGMIMDVCVLCVCVWCVVCGLGVRAHSSSSMCRYSGSSRLSICDVYASSMATMEMEPTTHE